MAKPIVFSLGSSETSFGMNKVDRSRLYGYKELEVLDDDGRRCDLATLADDGRTLVGKGGTGIGYLSADGNWCDKDQLKPVNLEGESMTPVKSSFGAAIELDEETTTDDYLQHTVRLIYQLDMPESPEQHKLIRKLQDGAIYKFKYSYRGGLEADTGFLLTNDENEIFMLIGDETAIEFVGLQQVATPLAEDGDSGGDMMDFGMI